MAITILVRNPNAAHEGCRILYHDIGDYLNREEKLEILREAGSIAGIEDWQEIAPDKHNDWIGQRDEAFQRLYPMGSKEAKAGRADNAIFRLYSRGFATSRDAYIYNFSRDACATNARAMVGDYMTATQVREEHPEYGIDDAVREHSSGLHWDDKLKRLNQRRVRVNFADDYIREVAYRPFVKQHLYADQVFSQRPALT